MLRALAGVGKKEISREDIEAAVRQELAGKLVSSLMSLVSGGGVAALTEIALPQRDTRQLSPDLPMTSRRGSTRAQCTACDECIKINGKIFAYNGEKKAYIKNASAGPYKDLVRAAEKCTARVIHPGLPRDRSPKDIAKWIQRGAKFN